MEVWVSGLNQSPAKGPEAEKSPEGSNPSASAILKNTEDQIFKSSASSALMWFIAKAPKHNEKLRP